jgi:hypothetical protein
MSTFYSLRIDTDEAQYELVSDILGVKQNSPKGGWIYEVIVRDNDPPFNFTDEFTSLMRGKMDLLRKLNITEDDIAIWIIYEYRGQCNFEFSPKELEKLSSLKITLCISCYDGGP